MSEQPVATLLYVDDDEVNRLAFTWLLQEAGFAVRPAGTGAEALHFAQDRPDLIVLDVNLPDLNGIEVCRRLKAAPATAAIPVLLLSGVFVKSTDKAQGLEGGADGYLVKPAEPQEVVATIKALLRARQAEEERTRLLRERAQLADQLSAAAARELGLLDSPVEVTRIEVRDHAHAIADALLTGFPTGELAEAVAAISAADALVVVTPTFQASYSGLCKSFFDLVESLAGVPVLLAATGGTERHSLVTEYALRPLVSYLGGVTVPTGVYAATQDLGGPGAPKLAERIDRAAAELATLTAGSPLPRRRKDDFADVTPFEEQLRRLRP